MKTYSFTTVCVVASVVATFSDLSQGRPPAEIGQTEVRAEVGRNLDEYLTRLADLGFSGAVLVSTDGVIVLSKGYGLANREKNIAVTPETVLPIGSITKQFTAAAILKLEMQGKLSVNDPITKYFEKVPPDKAGITLHHLLTHTAGLESDYGPSDFEEVSRDEIIRRTMSGPSRSAPGASHHYSNAGYSLLGAIVELVSGQSYETYLRENLFKPAEMADTGYKLPAWSSDRIAQGYRGGERWGTILERPWASDGPYWNLRANGGIHSTVVELYKWHLALEGDKILSDEAKKKYFAPHVDEGSGDSFYGYGWVTWTAPHRQRVSHNGGNGVFMADFRRYKANNVVIVGMSNNSDWDFTRVSPILEQIAFDDIYAMPPKAAKIDPTLLQRYAGTYALPSGAKFIASADGGRLALQADGQDAFSLLLAGEQVDSKVAGDLNERSAAIVREGAKGDFRPVHEAFGGRMPLERVQAMEGEMWNQRRAMFGAYKDCQALGTVPMPNGALTTTVRLSFAQRSVTNKFLWRNGVLAGIDAEPMATPETLVPVSETEFVSFKLGSPTSVQVRFEVGPEGAAKALAIQGKTGPIRAAKVE